MMVVLTLVGSSVLTLRTDAARSEEKPSSGSVNNLSNSVFLPLLSIPMEKAWPMAGANPQRTSWTPEEVRGNLTPTWYKQFEAYIPSKIQVIAEYNTLYISTSAGLYALDSETGAEKWVYPTALPLGQSPTIYSGVAFVGGFDKKLHALNALTGQELWTFVAGAGFDTSPVVADGKVFLGNRDGNFYAIYMQGPNTGQLAWKYQTGGPIDYSAAYKDGVVFFASNDSYAYALNAQTGSLVWKSAKLPGAGFYSWWPVVFDDWVIFAGSNGYRDVIKPGLGIAPEQADLMDVYPNRLTNSVGTLVGPLSAQPGNWAANTPTIDTSISQGGSLPITKYFEQKPWRRTYFVLSRADGHEYTTDFDHNGKSEYAPILWQGTHNGTRYPPIVGSDRVLYQANNYMSDPYIAGAQVTGWQIGTPYISIISSNWNAVDEPMAYSGGGNLIYWNRCCDRASGAIDISKPNVGFSQAYKSGKRPPINNYDHTREWIYFEYDLDSKIPGYSSRYWHDPMNQSGDPMYYALFGSQNGIYQSHGDQNPPIPYNGKVYMVRGNAVIALAPQVGQAVALPMAPIVKIQNPTIPVLTNDQIKTQLANEVQKIITAGHLMPGYISSGSSDYFLNSLCGDTLVDYWHNPGDILYTLIRALPYLSPDMQASTKTYLKMEFTAFPPTQYTHIGWKDGAARTVFTLPPEAEAARQNYPPQGSNTDFQGWTFAPQAFYAMWKYAEIFPSDAISIYNASKGKLQTTLPSNDYLMKMPHVLNAYIAGYIGFLGLEKLAGNPETTAIKQQLDRLINLRLTTFTKDVSSSYPLNSSLKWCRILNISANFMYLVPELGQYLHDQDISKVQQAIDEYVSVAPYWFVSNFDSDTWEGVTGDLYNLHSILQAKALILKEPGSELAKYLDVPATAVGDLFYIDNLVAVLEAQTP